MNPNYQEESRSQRGGANRSQDPRENEPAHRWRHLRDQDRGRDTSGWSGTDRGWAERDYQDNTSESWQRGPSADGDRAEPNGRNERNYGGQSYGGQNYGGQSYGGPNYGGQSYRSDANYGGQNYRNDGSSGGQDYRHDSGRSQRHRDDSSYGYGQSSYRQDRQNQGSYNQGYNYNQGQYGSSGFGGGANEDRSWPAHDAGSWRGQQAGNYPGFGQGSGYSGPGSGGGWSSSQSDSQQSRSSQRRGPKGYQRSDERLKEDICERLMQNHQIDAGEITVQVQNGKVSLEGTVPERRMKHSIEDLVDQCMGVKDIDNRLRVSRGEEDAQQGTRKAGSASSSAAGNSGSSGNQPGASASGSSSLGSSSTSNSGSSRGKDQQREREQA